MANLSDYGQIVTYDQNNDAVYVVTDLEGSAIDHWMSPGNLHKARTGNENVVSFGSLSAAVSQIGAILTTLEIPADITVSASLTIPTNITLLFLGVGMISVASGQTLTINGPIIAPLRQVFTGSGSVKFGGRIDTSYPEWFGALADNTTDDQAAIQKAIDAFKDTGIQHHPGIVHFTGGYAIGSTVLITGNSITLRSNGWGVQNDAPYRGFIRWIGSAGTPMIKITECWQSGVERIRLIGKSTAKPTAAIELASTNVAHGLDFSFVRHVYIGAMFGYDTDDATQFDAGILCSGTVDGDTNNFNHIQIIKCTTGVDVQNGNASISHWDTVTIGFCTTGFKLAGSSYAVGTNWFFAGNDADINLSGTGAKLMLREMGSESSKRMATIDGTAAQLIVLGGTWQAAAEFTPADSGSDRWFIDATPLPGLVHLEDFELREASTPFNPVLRFGQPGGSSSGMLRLINTNIPSDRIRTEPVGVNFLTYGVTVESTHRIENGQQPHIFSRCILDYTRTTEDNTFQPYRWDHAGKVNVFGGPLKVKSVFKPTGVSASAAVGSGATTYSYRVTALTYDGETEPSTAGTCTNGATLDSTHKNLVTWIQSNGAYAYRIYGRTSGTEQLLTTISADRMPGGPQWAYDDGSLTPSGALPVQNTSGTFSVEGALVTAPTSPAQLTANQNDYAPGVSPVLRLSSDASRNITGIVAGQDSRHLWIINVGAQNIVLTNQDAASVAENRIITGTGASVTIAADGSKHLFYDGITDRWRIID